MPPLWMPGDPMPGMAPPRVATVPRTEPDLASNTGPIPALGLFQLRIRDVLDFSIDFTQWLVGNGGCTLLDAVWEVGAGSPQTPLVKDQRHSAAGRCAIVLAPGADAAPGDAYWMDVTVDVSASAPVEGDDFVIPERTLTRRIHIVVVEG